MIEGMKISSIYGPRNIEAFQWDRSVLEYGLPHDITFQLIQDNSLMKNFVSFTHIKSINSNDYSKIQDVLSAIKKQLDDLSNQGRMHIVESYQFDLEDLKQGRLTQAPYLI
nr:hypothetical protein REIP_p305 [Rickettsia endosymbiont of Ixodes pacificus]AKS10382.1 hypothetical protein REIP_p420 [Rickettsia endosymbiont of Ixodes pacificus]